MRQHLRLAGIVAIAAAGAWVFVRALQSSVVDFARVTNESMLPHLKPGQVIVINKLAPCLKLPFYEHPVFVFSLRNRQRLSFPEPHAIRAKTGQICRKARSFVAAEKRHNLVYARCGD